MGKDEAIDLDSNLMRIMYDRYLEFRSSSNWDEKYKWETFGKLNEDFPKDGFNEDNILDKILLLQKRNPKEGSFLNWMSLVHLKGIAKENPNMLVKFIHLLIDEEKDISIRINQAREYFRENDSKGISLPAMSYILCSIDYKKYPIYKDDIFRSIYTRFNIKFPYGNDLGKKYKGYLKVCKGIAERLRSSLKDVTMLDGQDFLYVTSRYEEMVEQIIMKIFWLGYADNYENSKRKKEWEGIRDRIRKEKIEKMSRKDFIDFFIDFYKNGGYVQHMVGMKVNDVRNNIEDNYELFRKVVMDAYLEDIDLETWFSQALQIKNFGRSNFTALLMELHPEKYTIWNSKTENGLDRLLIKPKKERGESDASYYMKICKTQRSLMKYLPEGEDLHTVDAMMQFVVVDLPKMDLSNNVQNEFDIIFGSEQYKNSAFEFIREVFSLMDISDPVDPMIAVTIVHNGTGLRINYGRVVILTFWKDRIMLPLMGKMKEGEIKEDDSFKSFDKDVYLHIFEKEEYWPLSEDLYKKYKETLLYIKNSFKSHKKSSYHSRFHRKDIAEMILEGDTHSETRKPLFFSDIKEKLKVNFEKDITLDSLYFENGGHLNNQIKTTLNNGKHIILIGPPGTGKSKLAKIICETYVGKNKYKMTTATSDWSTYDTIGGYMPDDSDSNKLVFRNGHFLDCFRNGDGDPQNKWLILDEINRADIDKAFGSIFSALTGDNVYLNSKKNGEYVEIIGEPKDEDEVASHKYFIHPDWRIIATMNTFDKASLYEMSFAFMRRFAFINVGVPTNLDKSFYKLIEKWNRNVKPDKKLKPDEGVKEIWKKINEYRKIGPAIVEDMLKYASNNGKLSDAIPMYILPQLEGLTDDKKVDIIKEMMDVIPSNEEDTLKEVACDFFDMDKGKFDDKNKS